jgi:CubicO group peptidase (beta-lactamase class C family)
MVIKNITGQNYDDFLREQILAPLGIAHTQACVDVTQDLARGYRIFFLGGKPEYVDEVNPSFAYGAGDLCSTAMDLLEWQRALAMGRVVSNESYAMMISPTVLPDGTQTGYGFGLDIAENDGRKVIGHAGGIPSGFITQLSNYPDEYCGIVLLTNTLTPAYNPLASLESELVKALFASP